MYSKEESIKIKKEFWTQFAEAYPRKWILYDTKIKDFSFKFFVDNKKAQVLIDIEPKDEEKRKIYFEKIESLKTILIEDYIAEVILERNFHLETGKIISRIWVEMYGISLNNKSNWQDIFDFFYENMDAFERFFYENQDYLRFMACAPIEYYYHYGSKSERKPAYRWQLERARQRMDPAEYDHWKCYFEKLESENENSDILPDGFSLRPDRPAAGP